MSDKPKICTVCHGSGFQPMGRSASCPSCLGVGIEIQRPTTEQQGESQ
jgi:DnaJ-class molecular chaperone